MAMCLSEGLEENYEGNEIGGETQSAKDDGEIVPGNDRLVLEWRAVDGVAQWSVVGQ